MTVKRGVLIIAGVVFVLAAFGLEARINLIAAGLALWVLSLVL